MKKELRFQARIDLGEFDKTVDAMQRKLKQIYGASEQSRSTLETKQRLAAAGLGTAPTTQDKAKAEQEDRRTRQELDRFIKQQVKDQETIAKTINKRLEGMKELRKIEQDALKGSKEEMEIREKIKKSEEAIKNLRQQSSAKDVGINEALNRREMIQANQPQGWDRITNAYQRGGLGGAGRAAMRMPSFMMGALAQGMTGLGSAALFGSQLYGTYADLPQETLAARGATARGTYGQDVQNIFSGQGVRSTFFQPERAKAMQMAKDRIEKQRTQDIVETLGVLGIAGGAAYTGATVGAAAGSAVPGLGTALGGIAGGVGAGGAALFAGLRGNRYKLAMSNLPFVGDSFKESYEADLQSQQAQMYQQNLENLKSLSAVKTAFLDRYMQQAPADLALQRGAGLDDQALQQLYLRGTGAGFTMDSTRQMAGGILGAGGSSAAAANLSTMGNQLQRNMGLTNAAGIIGQLSQYSTSTATTENVTKRILAEGVRAGVSDLAAENRKFAETLTQVVVQSGGRTESEAGRLSTLFGSMMGGGTSMAAIQAGKGVFDLTQQVDKAKGTRAVYEQAFMQSNPILKKLDLRTKNALSEMGSGELMQDSPELAFAASQLMKQEPGKYNTVEDAQEAIRKEMLKGKSTKAFYDQYTDTQVSELSTMMRQKGVTSLEQAKKDPELKAKLGQAIVGAKFLGSELDNLSPEMKEQYMYSRAMGMQGDTEALKQMQEIEAKAKAAPTRDRDKLEAGRAKEDEAVLASFAKYGTELTSAADQTAIFTKKLMAASDALDKAFKTGTQKEIDEASKTMQDLIGAPQTQASPPGGK